MTTRRFLVVAAAVAVPGFLYAQLRDERAERERLRDEVVRLADVQARAARDAPALARLAGLPAPSAVVAAPPAEPPSPAPAAPSAPAAPPEPQVFFDGVFAAQRAASAWSASAQQQATARLTAALPPSSALRAVECRETMCQIETDHPDQEHYQQFFQRAFMDAATQAWNGAVTTVELTTASDGSIHAVSYLMREGVTLPRPSNEPALADGAARR